MSTGADQVIRKLLKDYFVAQLGWSERDCLRRIEAELRRDIPQGVLRSLASRGIALDGRTVLDVGSGLGGMVLELRLRGIDAHGAEPSPMWLETARLRLREAGFDDCIRPCPGEELDFPDESVDCVISLQVLEHVSDPARVLREIYRVLKPGGTAFLSCENYLSFKEMHYRVVWLPLLPKWIGAMYLRLRGRNASFLRDHVTYVTYPSLVRCVRKAGFRNRSFDCLAEKLTFPHGINNPLKRRLLEMALALAPASSVIAVGAALGHLRNTFRIGTQLLLEKPES